MAKIFKFSGYYVDMNGNHTSLSVWNAIDNATPDCIAHYIAVEEASIGEWDDDNLLNMTDCPLDECEKYF